MALYSAYDDKVLILTRTAQVEDDEFLPFLWQMSDYERFRSEGFSDSPGQMRADLLDALSRFRGDLDDDELSGTLDAEIAAVGRLRDLTLGVLTDMASCDGVSDLWLFGAADGRPSLNAEFRLMAPLIMLNLDSEAAMPFVKKIQSGNLSDSLCIPRRDLTASYTGRGLPVNNWIRRELWDLLVGTESEARVHVCPGCSLPFVVKRTNQKTCSIRCNNRVSDRRKNKIPPEIREGNPVK